MPSLKTSIDHNGPGFSQHASVEVALADEWKIQTGPLVPAGDITANFSGTLGTLFLSADGGAQARIADLAITLGALTVSATGTVSTTVDSSAILEAVSLLANATVPTTADLASTLGALGLSSDGSTGITFSVLMEDGSLILMESSGHVLME
jgi:hypothetical protein